MHFFRPVPKEYLHSAELRDIMQFGSSSQAVFFKMRVAGVLHIFQFDTRQVRRDRLGSCHPNLGREWYVSVCQVAKGLAASVLLGVKGTAMHERVSFCIACMMIKVLGGTGHTCATQFILICLAAMQGEDICVALQTHINDIMMKRYSKVCSPQCYSAELEDSISVCAGVYWQVLARVLF